MTATLSTPPRQNTAEIPGHRASLILGSSNLQRISTQIAAIPLASRAPAWWPFAFAAALFLLAVFIISILYMMLTGIGTMGNNRPVYWGFPITNFVWWIGIGHAGTLISAILYLLRQKWRNAINRFAEAMTLCAVACAGMMPLVHLGRLWYFYWIIPYPNEMRVWPGFLSALVWDFFAVSTYGTVSLLFWYLGMIPDLATLRVSAHTPLKRKIYGAMSLGWRGSARHYRIYETAYLILAALATPLVLSVHSVVSFDFATAQIPGWHSTLFPPYFVAGAIFSGFAMVISLVIPARKLFHLEKLITARHLENCAKVLLLNCWFVNYSYLVEIFTAYYSGASDERFAFLNRYLGPYAWISWIMIFCNCVVPQIFFWKKARLNLYVLWIAAGLVNIGMWLERYVIITTSTARTPDLPSVWGYFHGTYLDYCILLGSFGLFFTLFLLFCRYLPMLSMVEIKETLPEEEKNTPIPQSSPLQDLPAQPSYAIAAQFKNPALLKSAAAAIHFSGFSQWDCIIPFPIHGLYHAMGVKRSALPWVIFFAGATGTATALFFQWWMNGYDYPLNSSAKPYWSLPAHIPVAFELTILFASITAFLGFFAFARPTLNHPVTSNALLRRGLIDSYFIIIQSSDPHFHPATTPLLLQQLGGVNIQDIPHGNRSDSANPRITATSHRPKISTPIKTNLIILFLLLAVIPFALIARTRAITSPLTRLHLVYDMDHQPKFVPQSPATIFADGRSMRPRIPNTYAIQDFATQDPAIDRPIALGQSKDSQGVPHFLTTVPFPIDRAFLLRGQHQFNIFCTPCHGYSGYGDGMIAQQATRLGSTNIEGSQAWINPASLHDPRIRNQAVGEIYNTLTFGNRTMAAYETQIATPDRWAIAAYVKALQLSQNPPIEKPTNNSARKGAAVPSATPLAAGITP